MRKGQDMKKSIAAFVLVGFFIYTNPVGAEMTSTNYQIRWDSLTEGGSDTSTSTNYGIHDSVGGNALGNSTSTNYQTDSGYRAGIFDQVITFDVLLQNTSDARAVSARSGTTVSTAATTGLAAGGYVALIQDLGASQVSAIGKITSVSSGVSVTVDAWSDNGTTPTIDGSNDFLYPLNSSAIGLGQLSSSNITTAVIAFEVTADLTNGYSVQIMADGNLSSGANTINNVADGAVTAGVGEYGAISSDTSITTSTFDSQDTAITTSFQDVATETSAKYFKRNFLTLKAAPSTATISGNYSQSITLIASGNF
ncbi:hypothetical protein A3C09_04665 [Candidatus Uhrbacteria bacterium RIFCSPHIGHO2_02_FULL_47_44]|uniref:Uncharacterized protein n=1 Tax=Candidatus Uhrbacteria bacterium RIFCSPLOWO2_02_FULL_48_18 TaxID=1802408 RepID=A0A1F7VCN4_9BACT|nr:MAG: hypothetical protein A2839_04520 [Candidatus Uhrbacteria bacterium RIFCSPHIGHO2_01_FULL_47_10]OGL71923.1 MAG: hypothetical protein A3C09_04665 [Candidatus Uhrbacteria bacterium RIFCSPHIGHO2_02_FULL_47_44]OGL76551.1 MAG: hypothetical protein A3E97_02800 [Candidatus Uhrbacteria bacterium RIFCSPHIGHO2_12_FULL_47_12]OGL80548.1 MAG: hypothetical protein A3B20_04060 [Candidatus Uhrbacteria bacterium RIFCSPLOWO2_01_FULL_47_17]OGL88269.1 MAG: hypothetical protein A3I41_00920 [Candidatus Uhrbact